MLDYLNFEADGVGLPGNEGVSQEEHDKAKRRVRKTVRRAIDAGYPTVAWEVMTLEMSKTRPKPALYSLIVGYDEGAGTYLVRHGDYGEFSIRWDGFGRTLRLWIFKPLTESLDPAAHRRAIERAIESSKGLYPGHTLSAAHGLAAWEMLLSAFEKGTVSVSSITDHASFLIDARRAAATYLRSVESHFPKSATAYLQDVARSYDRAIAHLFALRALFGEVEPDLSRGTDILSKALEAERAAPESMQQALEVR